MMEIETASASAERWRQSVRAFLVMALLVAALMARSVSKEEQRKYLASARSNPRAVLLTVVVLVAFATDIVNK